MLSTCFTVDVYKIQIDVMLILLMLNLRQTSRTLSHIIDSTAVRLKG